MSRISFGQFITPNNLRPGMLYQDGPADQRVFRVVSPIGGPELVKQQVQGQPMQVLSQDVLVDVFTPAFMVYKPAGKETRVMSFEPETQTAMTSMQLNEKRATFDRRNELLTVSL